MIDLHTHTNISDGTDTVKELLENANNINLEVLSITDHDTTDAYYDVIKLRDLFKGIIIPGVELKAYYDGMPLEVLGYGIDHTKININRNAVFDMQVDCLEEFKNIGRSLGLKFDENIQVSKTDSRRKYASFTFAEELLKHKENESILLSIGPMFTQTEFYRVHASNKKSIFYYDESKLGITIEKAIDMIHNAGGLAFLAHPLIYPYEKDKFEEIEHILKTYNLDGIEVDYPLFTQNDRIKLREIAKKYNKYISGGTDYHANNKPDIKLGTGIENNMTITTEDIKEWLNKVNKM